MGKWFPRSRKDAFGADMVEPPNDVFEQPQRSLLVEALGRPVGFGAAVILVAAAAVFVANHFVFQMKRIDDFALVGFFVGGGILVSMLLRTGDPNLAVKKRTRKPRTAPRSDELVLEEPLDLAFAEADARPASGLAEARPAAASLAPARTPREPVAAKPSASQPPPISSVDEIEDDEVAGFQQALVHYVNAGDLHGQGEVLRRLGHLAKSRGHLRESQEFYVKARDSFRKIDDHYAEAAVLLDLGQVLESLDEHDAASAAYRDANRALLDVAMNSGDRYNAVQAHAAD